VALSVVAREGEWWIDFAVGQRGIVIRGAVAKRQRMRLCKRARGVEVPQKLEVVFVIDECAVVGLNEGMVRLYCR